MYHGRWHEGWGGWGLISMAIMMIVFWGGLIWLGVTLLRRTGHSSQMYTAAGAQPGGQPLLASPTPRLTPQETLADRLARGQIEPDDYRERIDVLRLERSTGQPDVT